MAKTDRLGLVLKIFTAAALAVLMATLVPGTALGADGAEPAAACSPNGTPSPPVRVAALAPAPVPVRIPMSDGKSLAGNLFLPAGNAEGTEYPTVLHMTPYGKDLNVPKWYGANCYAVLGVDVRGTGASEGELCLFCEREQLDVPEAIRWIAGQDWSNRKVALKGGSYAGITALFGAARAPEELKAVIVEHVTPDIYGDAAWHNGIYNANFITQWSAYQTGYSAAGTDSATRLPDRVRSTFPHEARLNEWDSEFYRSRSVYPLYDQIQVPTLFWTGWFDGFSRGTIRAFQGIAGENKKLFIEPFGHHYGSRSWEPNSRYKEFYEGSGKLYYPAVLAWLDRFLKDAPNEIENEPDVTYFDLGTRDWRKAEAWPPSGAATEELFLSGAPSAKETADGVFAGTLSVKPPAGDGERPDAYVYEPTAGASDTFSKFGEVAATPQLHLDQRGEEAKALTYTTEPIDRPVRIAGPMELRFWGTTTALDTDWVVKVSQVHPDGESELITSGYMRASHRRWDEERSRPAEPWITNQRPGPGRFGDGAPYVEAEDLSEPTEYRVDVWPTALTLQPDRRLRITISSSDVPTHEPLPLPAVNTILHDAKYPSKLIITTVKEPTPPALTLAVSPKEITGNGPVNITAEGTDEDGFAAADLTVVDGNGMVIASRSIADFGTTGSGRIALAVDDLQLQGLHPWAVTFTATDTAGATSTETETVDRVPAEQSDEGDERPEEGEENDPESEDASSNLGVAAVQRAFDSRRHI